MLYFIMMTNNYISLHFDMTLRRKSQPAGQMLERQLHRLVQTKLYRSALKTLKLSAFVRTQDVVVSQKKKPIVNHFGSNFKHKIIKDIQQKYSSLFNASLQAIPNHHTTVNLKSVIQPSQQLPLLKQKSRKKYQRKPTFCQNDITYNQRKNSRKLSRFETSSQKKGLSPGPSKKSKNSGTHTLTQNTRSKRLQRKNAIKLYEQKPNWQAQLLQNLNSIQGSNQRKNNIRVQLQKLVQYLTKRCGNQILSTYFQLQVSESFDSFKYLVQRLLFSSERELKMIAFLTYDINRDGFICEEDLYYFFQHLHSESKMLQDVKTIMKFFKNNRIRSTQTQIPSSLLLKRNKKTYDVWMHRPTKDINNHISKKGKVNQQFFMCYKEQTQREETKVQETDTTKDKQFQINFDVFLFIFDDKLPGLIDQLIDIFIGKLDKFKGNDTRGIKDKKGQDESEIKWNEDLNTAKTILLRARQQKRVLSIPLP